ncbi:MAG: GTP-binding protein [Actinomycetota bacterium]|nr:GTP-binding protein [Actinomycetota bacterium]
MTATTSTAASGSVDNGATDTDTDTAALDALAHRSLLRLATAGSVDDGKSTLLGRLLHESGSLTDDLVAAVERASARRGDSTVNLALVTDGLRAEREQGITIDVAYRYFTTPNRAFILADTPGHEQYTRNMVTGASNAEVAVVLVDARSGLVDQSRRHLAIAALLGVGEVILAVNKLDLVDYDEGTFKVIAKEALDFAAGLPWPVSVTPIPISALVGDNVVRPSEHLSWFDGPPLLPLLEAIDVAPATTVGSRLAVQWVIPPDAGAGRDTRMIAGRLVGHDLHVGDEVTLWPSGRSTTVAGLQVLGTSVEVARSGQAIAVELADDLDASRGDLLAGGAQPTVAASAVADVCWMDERPLRPGARYLVKHTTRTVRALVDRIDHRLDVTTSVHHDDPDHLGVNELGRVEFRFASPLVLDSYTDSRTTGRFVIIDEATNSTVGAAMIRLEAGT